MPCLSDSPWIGTPHWDSWIGVLSSETRIPMQPAAKIVGTTAAVTWTGPRTIGCSGPGGNYGVFFCRATGLREMELNQAPVLRRGRARVGRDFTRAQPREVST